MTSVLCNFIRGTRNGPRHRLIGQGGFTLIEIMVALAVIAIGMAAVMSAVSTTVNNAAGLRDRTFAQWVAMNKLTEMQLDHEWPGTHTYDGSSVLADHEWFWDMDVKKTPFDNMRLVTISVRANKDDKSSLVSLVGYVGKPSS